MPIRSNIKSSKFAPQIRLYDLANGSNKLKATISERLQAEYDIELYWYAEPKLFDIFDNGGRFVRKDGGNFLTDGFTIGDYVCFQFGFGGSGRTYFGTISAISENGDTLFSSAVLSGINGEYNETVQCIIYYAGNYLQSCIYGYGLIENSEPFNIISKLEGSSQQFYINGIDSLGEFGEINGTIKGWASEFDSIYIQTLGYTAIPIFRDVDFGGVGVGLVNNTVLNYKIRHRFLMLPYFVAGQLQNLQNGIAPSFLQGSNSIKHAFEVDFRRNLSDEDGQKKVQFENLLGSVGFFGENFNGFATQYSIESIDYEVVPSNLPNPSLLAQGITRVKIGVHSQNSTFTNTQNVIVNHSFLPQNETLYTDSTNYFDQNFLFDSITKGSGGAIVTDVSVNFIDANNIEVVALINTTNVPIKLKATDYYLLSVIIEDDAKTQENSDRTALICDINTYDLNPDIPGLCEFYNIKLYEHGTDQIETGNTDYKGWIQDGYLIKGNYRLNRLKNAILNQFMVKIVAWKDGTDDYFELQSNTFNVSNALIDVNGNQQLFINDIQGFKLQFGDQFNQKVMVTGVFDGEWIEYGFGIGLKINWQEWLALANVDTVFYDVLEPNFGLNQNASRYSLKEGYTLQTLCFAVVSQNGIETDYIHKSSMVVNDFGEIGTDDWELLAIQTFDVNNEDLQGSILNTESTYIKAEFMPNFVITPDIENYYGIIRIERQLSQSNKEIYELSSVRLYPTNNLLLPLDGENFLKLSLNGNNIVMECKTDFTKIQNIPYTISARLGQKGEIILGDFNDDFNDDFFN